MGRYKKTSVDTQKITVNYCNECLIMNPKCLMCNRPLIHELFCNKQKYDHHLCEECHKKISK